MRCDLPNVCCLHVAGPHVGGNAHEGLRQCCQLMGLPVSTLYATLQQLRLLEHTCSHRSSYCSYCSSSSRRRNEAPGHCAAAPSCSKLGNKGGSLSSSKGLQRVGVLRPPAGSSPPQTTAAATGLLGCACSRSDAGCSASTAQQWACGAAAHRQHCADSKTQPTGLTAAQRTTTEVSECSVGLWDMLTAPLALSSWGLSTQCVCLCCVAGRRRGGGPVSSGQRASAEAAGTEQMQLSH